jgi:hypothetical protein
VLFLFAIFLSHSKFFEKTAVDYADGSLFAYQLFPKTKLHGFVNGSGNNVILLFFRELNEIYRITRYANGKLGVFFRVRLRVQKRFTIEYVYVDVETAVANVGIQHLNQVIYSIRHNIISFLLLYFPQRAFANPSRKLAVILRCWKTISRLLCQANRA